MRSGGLLQGQDICQHKNHIGYGWTLKLENCLKKSQVKMDTVY
jgi:hypothetical protein